MEDNKRTDLFTELMNHINTALATLKHRQYFIITYAGDGHLTFASSKMSLNKKYENVDQFTANAVYMECISKHIFTVNTPFRCAPNTTFHLIYKRP